MRQFSELSEREILALAISLEEQHSRIYRDYADGLAESYPASAKVFLGMAEEEDEHRRWLIGSYRERFGSISHSSARRTLAALRATSPSGLCAPWAWMRCAARPAIELETRRFYERAQGRASDAGIRKLLGDLAAAERSHESLAERLRAEYLTGDAQQSEEATRQRLFVLQVVQPGLAGLMDGSVSTLAPLFAAAFATHNTWGDLSRRHGGLGRRGYLHGVRRSAF